MFNNRKSGPKPSKWTRNVSAAFTKFFARRTEPLDHAERETETLREETGVGWRWLFRGDDAEPVQVLAQPGARISNVVLGITGALAVMGNGSAPGEGSCERFWVSRVDGREVPEDAPGAIANVRGGTGDLQLRLDDGNLVWCGGRHCRPWQAGDSVDDLLCVRDELRVLF